LRLDRATEGEAETLANEQLLTIKEVCVLLRVSKWSVYKLIWSNQLHTVTIGRRRLVRPEAYAKCVDLLDGKAA
jgi:excisionase family DNA binding protein